MSQKLCIKIQNFGMFTLIALLVWTIFMSVSHAAEPYISVRQGVVAYSNSHVSVVLPLVTDTQIVQQRPPSVYRYEQQRVYSRSDYDDGYYAGRRQAEQRRAEEIRWKIEQRERERIRRQEEFDAGYSEGYISNR